MRNTSGDWAGCYRASTCAAVAHLVGFLNDISLIELLTGVVLIIGVIYYVAVQRKKPYTPPIQPEEDLAGIAPTTSPPPHTEG
jgi:hypothetical protein